MQFTTSFETANNLILCSILTHNSTTNEAQIRVSIHTVRGTDTVDGAHDNIPRCTTTRSDGVAHRYRKIADDHRVRAKLATRKARGGRL